MMQLNMYDVGLRTERDFTTDPLYVFTSYTLTPDANTASAEWVCTRTTVATGAVSFAQGALGKAVSNFDKPQSLLKASLAATYTY